MKKEKIVTSYFYWKIQNEIINLVGNKIRREIINQIKEAKYFSTMFDCTPDVSRIEQMSQIIRFVKISNGKCEIIEYFIDFMELAEKSGSGLANEILNKILSDGLDIANCRGPGYDIAANMAGKYKGVQAHVNRINNFAQFVPCAAHSLNLIGVHASEVTTTVITCFGLAEKIFTYFFGLYI